MFFVAHKQDYTRNLDGFIIIISVVVLFHSENQIKLIGLWILELEGGIQIELMKAILKFELKVK